MEQQEVVRLTQHSKGGGCGCKIAPSVLQQIVKTSNKGAFDNLLVGYDTADDAAVYQINEHTAVISTTDFFMPIVDNAFDFGRIAAANAISDVYAMGGTPLMAIAILGWPIDKLPAEVAQQVLEGGRSICLQAGIPLAGGHTVDAQDPIFGLAVTGTIDVKNLKQNNNAQPGDLLFLTKAIGTGILSTSLKRGLLKEEHYAPLLEQMTRLNSIGAELGKLESVHSMTDVTGFGILGHAGEMATGSGVSIHLSYHAIKKLAGVESYIGQKAIPGATARNWNSYGHNVQLEEGIDEAIALKLLPDPQTNGGLLFAVAPEAAEEVVALLEKNGLHPHIQPIGYCTERGGKAIVVHNE